MRFQTRNPIQQCASALARCCDAIDRCLTNIVWVLGGVAFGVMLLALIALLRTPY